MPGCARAASRGRACDSFLCPPFLVQQCRVETAGETGLAAPRVTLGKAVEGPEDTVLCTVRVE